MPIDQSKIEQAYEEKEKLFRKYEVARQKYNDLKIQEYKDKWLGQFITIDNEPNSEQYWKHPTYLFVTNIWYSSNDNIMYVEGVGFSGQYTEYRDETYFTWSTFIQERIPYDWLENEHMIKVDLIDKETYDKAFYGLIDQMRKEHQDYEYTIDEDKPDDEDDGPHYKDCPD
jgi:hypothetical protein